MLKRLYIDNFRCFVNFEFKPERKQLLLGPNGSGKSSLLTAIRFIKEFVEERGRPLSQSSRTRWSNRPIQVFEIEALIEEATFEYRVEIRYSPELRLPSIKLETLKVSGQPIFELVEGKVRFFPDGGSASIALHWEANESTLHLAQFSNRQVGRFVEWLQAMHCFQIDAYEGKMEDTADTILKMPDFELEYLAQWYLNCVQEDPEGVGYLQASLRETLTGFEQLRFTREKDGVNRLHADFKDSSGRRATFSIEELSDGQRCLIALYMILHFLIAKGHTVFLDEPDNFIALREIQPWLLAAEDAVQERKGQLILISHHPEILNQWAHEYGIQLYREENGQVAPPRQYKTSYDEVLQPAEIVARGWENE